MEEDLTHEYSVCQFFIDGSHDYELRFVAPGTAIKAFTRLTRSIGAKIGTTKSVIITDGGDCTNMEWQHGRGITFPPELVGK